MNNIIVFSISTHNNRYFVELEVLIILFLYFLFRIKCPRQYFESLQNKTLKHFLDNAKVRLKRPIIQYNSLLLWNNSACIMKLNRIKTVLAERVFLKHGWLRNLARVSVWSMRMLVIVHSLIWILFSKLRRFFKLI